MLPFAWYLSRMNRVALLAVPLLVCFAAGCDDAGGRGDSALHLRAGWDYYRSAEYHLSAREFGQALRAAPSNGPDHQQALYGLATTLDLGRPDRDAARATQLYEQIIRESPDGDLAAWSMLALARMKEVIGVGETIDRAAAKSAYQRVIDRYPNHAAAEEALLHQQALVVNTLRPEDARAALPLLVHFIDTHPASPWRSAFYTQIAGCQTILND